MRLDQDTFRLKYEYEYLPHHDTHPIIQGTSVGIQHTYRAISAIPEPPHIVLIRAPL